MTSTETSLACQCARAAAAAWAAGGKRQECPPERIRRTPTLESYWVRKSAGWVFEWYLLQEPHSEPKLLMSLSFWRQLPTPYCTSDCRTTRRYGTAWDRMGLTNI